MTQVAVARDPWDVVVLAVGIVAGITAIIGFGYWILAQRRRPEVQFFWQISTTGSVTDLRPWPQDEPPEVVVGATILVETNIWNIGDATAMHALSNFVVPDCFSLRLFDNDRVKAMVAGNKTAGYPPTDAVRFIPIEKPIYPAVWWPQRYCLVLESIPEGKNAARFMMELSEDRLNGSGSRRWWSRTAPLEIPDYPVETPWPETRRLKHQWRKISVGNSNGDRVMCYPGGRKTTRDVVLRAS